jgi:hypothetical protein
MVDISEFTEYYTMIIEPNYSNPKKDTSNVKIGDVILISTGYAKVACHNPIKGVSIARGAKI